LLHKPRDIRFELTQGISNEGTTDSADGQATSSTKEHATAAALLLATLRVGLTISGLTVGGRLAVTGLTVGAGSTVAGLTVRARGAVAAGGRRAAVVVTSVALGASKGAGAVTVTAGGGSGMLPLRTAGGLIDIEPSLVLVVPLNQPAAGSRRGGHGRLSGRGRRGGAVIVAALAVTALAVTALAVTALAVARVGLLRVSGLGGIVAAAGVLRLGRVAARAC
jgi:hypothetical protein